MAPKTFQTAIGLALATFVLAATPGYGGHTWLVSSEDQNSQTSPKPVKIDPILRFDLRSVGYTGFAPKWERPNILQLEPNPICFSKKDILIATFITHEQIATLPRRDQSGQDLPLRLHGIFLDIDAGKVQVTKEWQITRPRGGIIAAGEGSFVVLTPEMIARYAADLQLLKDFKLSSDQQSHLWDLRPSPSGNTILVESNHYPDHAGSYYQWFDTNSMQLFPAWDAVISNSSVSDDDVSVEHETYVKPTGFIAEVLIMPRGGQERTICREIVGSGTHCGRPNYLSNDVLLLEYSHGFAVVNKNSARGLFLDNFPEEEWLGQFYPSADGKRFAATISEHKGENPFLDTTGRTVLKRVVVYDIPSRRPIFALDAKGLKITSVSGIALSPDGSLLALMVDGVVEVYQVPSPS